MGLSPYLIDLVFYPIKPVVVHYPTLIVENIIKKRNKRYTIVYSNGFH